MPFTVLGVAIACTTTPAPAPGPVPVVPEPAPAPDPAPRRKAGKARQRPPREGGGQKDWWASTWLADDCVGGQCVQHLLLLDPGGSAYLVSRGTQGDRQVTGTVKAKGDRAEIVCRGADCRTVDDGRIDPGTVMLVLERAESKRGNPVTTQWRAFRPAFDGDADFVGRERLDDKKPASELPKDECCCAISMDDQFVAFAVDHRKLCYDGVACVPNTIEVWCDLSVGPPGE